MTTNIETDLLLKVLSQSQELMLIGKEINRTHEYNVQTHNEGFCSVCFLRQHLIKWMCQLNYQL